MQERALAIYAAGGEGERRTGRQRKRARGGREAAETDFSDLCLRE